MGRSDKLRPFSTTRRREKMNRINTVESRVLQILRNSPETRYEDRLCRCSENEMGAKTPISF